MKRIIVVEDDASILETMLIILKSAGYSAVGFFDGSFILQDDFDVPDLFILDKQLNGVDGLDICRHLKNREATKNIPVVMVSANPLIVNLAKDAGADDAIEKPFRMVHLKEVVAKYLR